MPDELLQFMPRYRAIAHRLRQQIRGGQYQPNERIPSEAMLVKQYEVSRGTVREALDLLTQEELLLRRPGVGTIVASKKKPLHKTTLVFSHAGAYSLTHPYLNRLYHSFETGVEEISLGNGSDVSVQSIRLARAANDYGISLLEAEDAFQGRMIDARHTQGLCLTSALPEEEVIEVQKRGISCVHLDGLEGSKCPNVYLDRYKVRELALLHLKDLGHRNIGVVTTSDVEALSPWPKVRTRLKQTAEELGLNLDDRYNLFSPDWKRELSVPGVRDLLKREDRPTGLICGDDFLAMGAWDAAKELGLSVPGDLSIVGLGNYLPDTMLTTIETPLEQMGRIAAEILVKTVETAYDGPSQICLDECKLVIRASTGHVRG